MSENAKMSHLRENARKVQGVILDYRQCCVQATWAKFLEALDWLPLTKLGETLDKLHQITKEKTNRTFDHQVNEQKLSSYIESIH